MANISAILAVLFCAIAPVASVVEATPKTEVLQSNFQLGRETISQIRTAYTKGEYNQFLSEADRAYKEADLSGLIEMRQGKIDVLEAAVGAWEKQMLELRKEKQEALLGAVKDSDDSVFAQKVRSAAAHVLSAEQEKAVLQLNSLISKVPGKGINSDENRLIEIDLEYEFKLHSLTPSVDGRLVEQIALRMEKMDKMVESAKSFQDHSLKQAVGMAADTFDVRMAQLLDGADLNKLVQNKAKPSTSTEEKVFSVLGLYQGKFSDLMKEISKTIQ